MTTKKTKAVAKKKATPALAEKEKKQIYSRYAMRPSVNAAGIVNKYSKFMFGDIFGQEELADEISRAMTAVNDGNMKRVENMLFGQAIALQTMFTNLALRADSQEGRLDNIESLMRMALRAQSQCRMTLETLANIKNPPVVYARQANISQGHQQVNNGVPEQTRAREEKTISTNELLEAHDGKRLDTRTQGKTGRDDPEVETVEISGSQNIRRKSA